MAYHQIPFSPAPLGGKRMTHDDQQKLIENYKKNSCPPADGFYEIMELGYRHMTPLAINAALVLGIPDILARAGKGACLSVEEIADQLSRRDSNSAELIGRIMRLLVLSDVFSESVVRSDKSGKLESRFGLTHLSKWLVTHDNEFNLVPMMFMKMRKEMVNSFMHLHSAVLDGLDPFQLTNGATIFEYTGINPGFGKVFDAALTARAKTMNWTIANQYAGFHEIRTLVDVGGCRGQALTSIVSRHPHIQGINLDLPHVIEKAPFIPGVRHEAGDMFKSIPHADAILMEQVLHDWNDENCELILRRCHAAIPDTGRLIIRENVRRPTTDHSAQAKVTHAANLGMLSYCGQGKERSAEEWRELLYRVGFDRVNFLNFSGLDVLEVFKSVY